MFQQENVGVHQQLTNSPDAALVREFDFLAPISFLKTREASSSSKRKIHTLVDEKGNVIFELVDESLVSQQGLVFTIRNVEKKNIGKVIYQFVKNRLVSSDTYRMDKQRILVTAIDGRLLGTIEMHNATSYDISNGIGELIMELKPTTNFVSKTSYPITANGLIVAYAEHGVKATSLQMPNDISPSIKLLLAVLTDWLSTLKVKEEKVQSSSKK